MLRLNDFDISHQILHQKLKYLSCVIHEANSYCLRCTQLTHLWETLTFKWYITGNSKGLLETSRTVLDGNFRETLMRLVISILHTVSVLFSSTVLFVFFKGHIWPSDRGTKTSATLDHRVDSVQSPRGYKSLITSHHAPPWKTIGLGLSVHYSGGPASSCINQSSFT